MVEVGVLMDYLAVARKAIEIGAVQDEVELAKLLQILDGRSVKNVLEIGSYRGGTLWAWCQLSQEGFIVGIDNGHIPRDLFHVWHPDMWTPKHDSHDPTMPMRLQRRLDKRNAQLDFLFIDGGHSYSDAQQDFEMYSPLVRQGGVIAFHDIASKHECAKYWLDVRLGRNWHIIDQGVGMGIGIIFK